MNTKITLFLIFIVLVLLLLYYHLNIESNIIILLGVVIILLVNDLIVNKEHFYNNHTPGDKFDTLSSRLDDLDSQLERLHSSQNLQEEVIDDVDGIEIIDSCAPSDLPSAETSESIAVRETQEDSDEKICVPGLNGEQCLDLDIEAVEKLASGIE